MRDVGEMGESTLKLWASQLGISANKASQDKTGWDFLLEFPLAHAIQGGFSIALDKGSFPLKCSIQVKSTDKRPGKWPVKLDNWLRFVKSPLPTFFLVLEFNARKVCQRAFLVHVDESYIRRVLKRLREIEVVKGKELHKMTLQLTYGENDALPSLDGNGLEQAIRRHVEGSLEDYSKRKIELVETVGYEDGYALINFSISPSSKEDVDIQEQLINSIIGLMPQMEIASGYVTDVRFGLLASKPSVIFEEGTIVKITSSPIGKAVVRLNTSDRRREFRIEMDTYAPRGFIPEVIDRKYLKIRLAIPFTDMVLVPYLSQIGLNFELPNPTEKHPLRDLQATSALVLFLHEALQKYNSVNFEISINSLRIVSGQINTRIYLQEDFVKYATDIDNAWKIAKYFDVHQHIDLKPAELFGQRNQITLMSLSVGTIQGLLQLCFSLGDDIPDDTKDCCVPLITHVIIGQYRMIVATALLGSLNKTGQIIDDKIEFEFTIVRMDRRKYLYNRQDNVDLTAENLIDAINDDYKDSHYVLALKM